jgi:hypothetical protein
LGDEIERRK